MDIGEGSQNSACSRLNGQQPEFAADPVSGEVRRFLTGRSRPGNLLLYPTLISAHVYHVPASWCDTSGEKWAGQVPP